MCLRIIRHPSGRCPIAIESHPTDPEVIDWFYRVRVWGLGRGTYLTREAILAWASSIIDDEDVIRTLSRHAPHDDDSFRLHVL